MIKNIFFDFDGVLAESVNIKTAAFKQMYQPYGEEIADRVVAHHLANGGVSRFEKFALYHGEWLGLPVNNDIITELAKRFSGLVIKNVINSPSVIGADHFLAENRDKYDYWIITGTPTEEMDFILKSRSLDTYFKGIYGSPTQKSDWTEFILDKWKLEREETVFIGDAEEDMKAANHSSLKFILRETDENREIFSDYKGPKLADLTFLNALLENIR